MPETVAFFQSPGEISGLAKGLADWFDANKGRIAYRVSRDESHCDTSGPCEGRLRWTEQDGEREVVYSKDPRTGAITRFAVALVALLPIEGQL